MMRKYPHVTMIILSSLLLLSITDRSEAETRLQANLKLLQQVGPEGQGHANAIRVWQEVAQSPASELTSILGAMRADQPLANNWLRAAVDTIAERTIDAGDSLPLDSLLAYLGDPSHDPRSRRLAFEWILKVDPTQRDRLVPTFLNDPSLELRRDAVAELMSQAEQQTKAGSLDIAKMEYRRILTAARDTDQIESIAKSLRDLGEEVDLPRHFGFIMQWQLVGPFDNVNDVGFDRVYPPEESLNLSSSYEGKEGPISWQPAVTEDDYGNVDLNAELGKSMGAVAYALAVFPSSESRPVEIRIGSTNANKVWLNGKLITSNHAYHSGDGIDQYVGRGQLGVGRNLILVKVCQNEQTESWAQDWEFQLRVCDHLGTAILPDDQE